EITMDQVELRPCVHRSPGQEVFVQYLLWGSRYPKQLFQPLHLRVAPALMLALNKVAGYGIPGHLSNFWVGLDLGGDRDLLTHVHSSYMQLLSRLLDCPFRVKRPLRLMI